MTPHRRLAEALGALALLAPALPAEAKVAPAADPALAQVSQDWAKAWSSGALEATLDLYAEDATFLSADGSRIGGKPALRAFFTQVLAQYAARPSLHSLGSARSGDLGYDWGDYTEVLTPAAAPDRPIRTHGDYLVVLRRTGGRWRIVTQMWTAATPVPEAK